MLNSLCQRLAKMWIMGFRWDDEMGWSKSAIGFQKASLKEVLVMNAMTVIWDKYTFIGNVPPLRRCLSSNEINIRVNIYKVYWWPRKHLMKKMIFLQLFPRLKSAIIGMSIEGVKNFKKSIFIFRHKKYFQFLSIRA